MSETYKLNTVDIMPSAQETLTLQKMTRQALPSRIMRLLEEARGIFGELAAPLAVVENLVVGDFPDLYQGCGMNAPDGPVPAIVARAEALTLMAATMGDALAAKTTELMTGGGAALGYMLDAVNAAGAERLGRHICRLLLTRFSATAATAPEDRRLRAQYYCPGHCGWHISGQERLFAALHPEVIGMSLNARWVMRPLKSISGVVAIAPLAVHRFTPGFSFCPHCREHKCVERLRLLEAEDVG